MDSVEAADPDPMPDRIWTQPSPKKLLKRDHPVLARGNLRNQPAGMGEFSAHPRL
jgi:hypothetical protein